MENWLVYYNFDQIWTLFNTLFNSQALEFFNKILRTYTEKNNHGSYYKLPL